MQDAVNRLEASGSDGELIALAKDCLGGELEDRPRHAGEVVGRINAYRTGVEERLRLAEVARAEEKARAEEASKRARVERDRLRLTVGLAASLLALVTLGGSGAAWVLQQRQDRLTGVEKTLARIQAFRDQAAASGADPARWGEVLAAADEALGSLGDLAASEPGRRLAALRTTIARDGEQAERDVKLVGRLNDIRSSAANSSGKIDHAVYLRFRFAFKRYGLDLETTPLKEAIAKLGSRPELFVRDVVAGLEHWLLFAQETEGYHEKAQTIVDLLKGLDPEAGRNRLRALLVETDLKTRREALIKMANEAGLVEYGASTALLLARSLDRAGEGKNAIAVLRAAVARYPGDVWANLELAKLLKNAWPPQREDAIRYYAVARALRPESGFDLAEVLEEHGRIDDAEAIYKDLVRRDPEPFLFQFRLLKLLQKGGKINEARSIAERIVAPFRDGVRRESESALAHAWFIESLWLTANRTGAIAAMREATQYFENQPNFYHTLGDMLVVLDDFKGAIAAYRESIRIDPSNADSHRVLAWALGRVGDRTAEILELRKAIRIGSALPEQAEANPIQSASPARDLWVEGLFPSFSFLPWNEGPRAQTLKVKDQIEPVDELLDYGQIGSFRLGFIIGFGMGTDGEREPPDAVPLKLLNEVYLEAYFLGSFWFMVPHVALEQGHLALGAALAESGDLPGAISAYSEAIRLGEGDAQSKATAYDSLGSARWLTGARSEAIDAFREAIRANPDQPHEARYNLGLALAESGDLPGAITALREATQRQQPTQAGSFHLLRAIVMSPRPKDAVEALKRVRDTARDDGPVRKAIEVSLSQFERLSKLGVPIPRVFRLSPYSNSFPAHCYSLRLFAASAAIWAAGFTADPSLAEDMQAQNRYLAASAAVLAAAGHGIDQPRLDDEARSRWRKQALEWLNADLDYWSKQVESDEPQPKVLVRTTLQHWQVDRDLASVRDESNLKGLLEDERKAWQAYWNRVAALLKSADQD